MNDTVDRAQRILRERLAEIDAERHKLERALASLTERPPAVSRSSRRRATAAKRKPARRRARRGERETQLLAEIKRSPRTKTGELAKRMGVAPQQLYPLLRRLTDDKRIKKAGEGFQLRGGDEN